MIVCVKFFKKIPGAILVCFGAIAAVHFLHLPVETIGTRFGGIPSGLPHIVVPALASSTCCSTCFRPPSPSPCWAPSNR